MPCSERTNPHLSLCILRQKKVSFSENTEDEKAKNENKAPQAAYFPIPIPAHASSHQFLVILYTYPKMD